MTKKKTIKFPIRWLSYKQRVRNDVERAFSTSEGQAFLNDHFVSKLESDIRRLEGWQIRLFLAQFAIVLFLTIGLSTPNSSLSLFGISLKSDPGVKEILLGISATLTILIWMVSAFKDLRLIVSEKIIELTTEKEMQGFASLIAPSSFNSATYFAKAYKHYHFATLPTKILFAIPAAILILIILSLIIFSLVVYVALIVDVHQNPTLPKHWSLAVIVYAIAAQVMGIFWLIRFWTPLPYHDQSVLLELEALKKTNMKEYNRRLLELMPSD